MVLPNSGSCSVLLITLSRWRHERKDPREYSSNLGAQSRYFRRLATSERACSPRAPHSCTYKHAHNSSGEPAASACYGLASDKASVLQQHNTTQQKQQQWRQHTYTYTQYLYEESLNYKYISTKRSLKLQACDRILASVQIRKFKTQTITLTRSIFPRASKQARN